MRRGGAAREGCFCFNVDFPVWMIHAPDKVVWVLRPETGALPNVYYTND